MPAFLSSTSTPWTARRAIRGWAWELVGATVSVVLRPRRVRLGDQRRQLGGALGRAVELEVQRWHGVDLQALEEAVADEARRLFQRLLVLGWRAGQHREEDGRMGVVGRDLDGMDRH